MQRCVSILLVMYLGSMILWSGCGAGKPAPEAPAESVPETPVKAAPEPTTEQAVEQELDEIPEWFLDVPKDPGYVYAAVVGAAADTLGLAVRMAEHEARAEIGRQVKYSFQEFITESGVSTEMTSSVSIMGVEMVHRKVVKEGPKFKAYVLIRVPIDQVKASIVETVKSDEDLLNKLKDSPKYKELVKEVEEGKKTE